MLTKKNIKMEQKENREINSIIKKLEKAEIKGDALQIYLCCDALLEIYASNYGAEMAVALCQKAIDALQEAGAARRAELASAYYKQGLFLQDKYYRALPCFKKAMDLFSQVNDDNGIAASAA